MMRVPRQTRGGVTRVRPESFDYVINPFAALPMSRALKRVATRRVSKRSSHLPKSSMP